MDEAELVKNLSDPMWRLCNLYWILDKDGKRVLFKPNEAQALLLKNLWYRNLVLKARQRGFSTLIQLLGLDTALFNDNLFAGVIAHEKEAAEAIFQNKIVFAYDNLPEMVKQMVPVERKTTKMMIFANGSTIRVATSLRSGTIQFLHISEFGKICAKYPAKAREVLTGTLPTVDKNGIIFIESTAEGREGAFFDMSQQSLADKQLHKKLASLEYRFHFFSWWDATEYEIDPDGIIITDKDHEYFDALEAKIERRLSMRKRAWYVTKRKSEFSGDQQMMYQEYPSTPEEAFSVSTEGCYYTMQLADARKQGRITEVPWVPNVPVNTFWDIGLNDEMSIWFHQQVGIQHRFIRYYENSGESFVHYVQYMQSQGYIWGRHYLPHDGDTERLGAERNWTPRQMLEELGLKNIEIVPRIESVITGIHMTRDKFSQAWFDKTNCDEGIKHLELYRKDWNDRLSCWRDTPRHDVHSNGADAFRQWAQAYRPANTGTKKRRRVSGMAA
ncbi:hypothetical protein BKM35_22100 [Salmonella enterica]|nr:hypothetical protein [Salmonella enterica]